MGGAAGERRTVGLGEGDLKLGKGVLRGLKREEEKRKEECDWGRLRKEVVLMKAI